MSRAWQEENIVDILNDDCWRHILNYVPVKDIVRSERVSRRWRALVRWYLLGTGVRIKIQTITNIWDVDNHEKWRECNINVTDNAILFHAVINKWATSVVEIFFDAKNTNEGALRSLGAQCPNLENITFVRLKEFSSCDWTANFTRLKRVCFENCSMLDRSVTAFLKNNTIQELVIRMTNSITGDFLRNGEDLRNLKTLILSRCLMLDFKHLLLTVEPIDYLSGVTRLELRDLPDVVHVQAHLILSHMPQLEHLTVDSRIGYTDGMGTAVARLENLRYLGWTDGEVLHGDELQATLKDVYRFMAWCRGGPARTSRSLFAWDRRQERMWRYRLAALARAAATHRRLESDGTGVGIVREFRR